MASYKDQYDNLLNRLRDSSNDVERQELTEELREFMSDHAEYEADAELLTEPEETLPEAQGSLENRVEVSEERKVGRRRFLMKVGDAYLTSVVWTAGLGSVLTSTIEAVVSNPKVVTNKLTQLTSKKGLGQMVSDYALGTSTKVPGKYDTPIFIGAVMLAYLGTSKVRQYFFNKGKSIFNFFINKYTLGVAGIAAAYSYLGPNAGKVAITLGAGAIGITAVKGVANTVKNISTEGSLLAGSLAAHYFGHNGIGNVLFLGAGYCAYENIIKPEIKAIKDYVIITANDIKNGIADIYNVTISKEGAMITAGIALHNLVNQNLGYVVGGLGVLSGLVKHYGPELVNSTKEIKENIGNKIKQITGNPDVR